MLTKYTVYDVCHAPVTSRYTYDSIAKPTTGGCSSYIRDCVYTVDTMRTQKTVALRDSIAQCVINVIKSVREGDASSSSDTVHSKSSE